MPVICGICLEALVCTRSDSDPGDKDALALTCGHIQHRSCLQKWFASKPSRPPGIAPCPICKIVNSIKNAVQVYPTMDDDQMQQQLIAAQSRIEYLTTRNGQLGGENGRLKLDVDAQIARNEVIRQQRNDIDKEKSQIDLENQLLISRNKTLLNENTRLKNSMEKARLKVIEISKGVRKMTHEENKSSTLKRKKQSSLTLKMRIPNTTVNSSTSGKRKKGVGQLVDTDDYAVNLQNKRKAMNVEEEESDDSSPDKRDQTDAN